MSVSNQALRISHTATDGQTTFSFDFNLPVATDASVYVNGELLDQDAYSVSGLNDEDGGTITLDEGVEENDEVVIVRTTERIQSTVYQTGAAFSASSHERALDRLTYLVQDLYDASKRSLKVPITEEVDSIEMPPIADNVAKIPRVAADGASFEFIEPNDSDLWSVAIRETDTATQGQTAFTTSTAYGVGLNQLHVYINGVRQLPTAYTETDANTVTFSEGLDAGDVVEFITGFAYAAAITKPEVTGSTGGNAALQSLLSALESLGLITDSTT